VVKSFCSAQANEPRLGSSAGQQVTYVGSLAFPYDNMVNKSIDPILNFNLVCCVGGGFIALFGLVSYLLKEGFYVTEPRMCTYTPGTQFPVTLTSMASCISLRRSFPIAIWCSSHPPTRIRQLSRSTRYCHTLLYAPRVGNTTCYSWNTAA